MEELQDLTQVLFINLFALVEQEFPVTPGVPVQIQRLEYATWEQFEFSESKLLQLPQTCIFVPILILLILVLQEYPQHFWAFGDGLGTSAANPTYTYANVANTQLCVAIDPSAL